VLLLFLILLVFLSLPLQYVRPDCSGNTAEHRPEHPSAYLVS
jgi:hypothetical protein